jgi:hypothetical protein
MDRRPHILYGALASMALLAAFHFAASAFYLYWAYWWTDVIMHFLGGLTGGLAAYWTLFHSGHLFKRGLKSDFAAVLLVFACVMAAGVAWEVFESVNGIIDSHEGHALDVMNDLILDGAGAVLAAMIGLRKRHG